MKALDLRELRGQRLRHPVGEVFLACVLREVAQREDGDGALVGRPRAVGPDRRGRRRGRHRLTLLAPLNDEHSERDACRRPDDLGGDATGEVVPVLARFFLLLQRLGRRVIGPEGARRVLRRRYEVGWFGHQASPGDYRRLVSGFAPVDREDGATRG